MLFAPRGRLRAQAGRRSRRQAVEASYGEAENGGDMRPGMGIFWWVRDLGEGWARRGRFLDTGVWQYAWKESDGLSKIGRTVLLHCG